MRKGGDFWIRQGCGGGERRLREHQCPWLRRWPKEDSVGADVRRASFHRSQTVPVIKPAASNTIISAV